MRDRDVERLYRAHVHKLFSFLVAQTGDRQLAEDLVAETFVKVLRGKGRFDRRKGGEKTWLYAIAVNLARDERRRAGAEARALEAVIATPRPPGVSAVELVERRDTMERAIAVLSPEERETIDLRYRADLTVPEIAHVTGEPLTTVDGRLYRALRKLRDELG